MYWGKLTLIFLMLAVSLRLEARPQIRTSSNLNSSAVNPFATLQPPLEIPFPQPRQSDPNSVSHPPINEKQSIGLHAAPVPRLQWQGLRDRMVHIDYQMVFEDAPPNSVFEAHYNEDYHLLENLQFYVTMANPSESFSVCVSEIFSDCEGIKKMLKRPLPLCLSPFTKYPFYFNLYLTHFRNAPELKTAIFFNVSLRYQGNEVTTRIWMKEVAFKLLPNHLKLSPLQFRNCQSENGTVFIKNPEKHDLSFLVIHKYKKYHFNGQQLDDKFVIAAQKSLRFMIEPKDSTMTIYSKTVENSDKSFPVLFLPVYCFDRLIIENINIGVISFKSAAFSYPLLLTSNSNTSILVQEVSLFASSQTVEIVKIPHSKPYIAPNERQVVIAAMVVRASLKPSLKNTVTLKVQYSLLGSNSNNSFEARRTITYSQLYGAVEIGSNRFYELGRIPEGELSDSQRIQYFNYTITNQLQIPIRLEKIHFNKNIYHMHWFRYTGFYAFPMRAIDEILLEYVGPKNLSVSPARHVVNFQFNGGVILPVETLVYDRTLTCFFQGKELRCSSIKFINFGYQRNDQKVQKQIISIRNFNPHNLTLRIEKPPKNVSKNGIEFILSLSQPFPQYNSEQRVDAHKLQASVRSGHCINLTIQMRIKALPVSGETLLRFSTEHESFATRVKFIFQEGKLFLTPPIYNINHFDREHQGSLQLLSTYQDVFQIREIVSDTTCLHFDYNQSIEYQPNQKVLIPFRFVPNQEENNLTQDCCSEQFLRRHYIDSLIHYSQSQVKQHQVTVITSIDLQQQLTVRVDTQKAKLLDYDKKILLSTLRVGRQTKVCLTVNNPYSSTLKYGVFLIPDEVTYKPKAYSDYLKHARRERTEAFLCLQEKNSPSFMKRIFHLDQDPKEVIFDVDSEGKIVWPQHYRENFSSNDYVSAFVRTGKEKCYRISTFLYFKLMIESEIINKLLQHFDFDLIEKFMDKEWEHLQQNTIVAFTDDLFYQRITLNFKEYCNKIFFPIFRFCFFKPIAFDLRDTITNQAMPKNSSAHRQLFLNSNKSQQFCISIPFMKNQNHISFQLVLANNFSKYDDYNVEMHLIEPQILISNIAFEREKVVENLIFIKHETFVKHYFSALSKASPGELQGESIVLSRVVPILLTNLDYEEQFQLFKGERFFEIENQAPIDIPFSHFGFEDKENITSWSGLEVEAADGLSELGLPSNGKKVFRVSYRFDRMEELNLSNPYYHKKIQLYLYQGEEYYLPLTLLIRVSENSIQKLKGPSVPTENTSTRLPYVLLNFLSLAYICFAILYFVKEKKESNIKVEAALLKHKKITPRKKDKKKYLYEMGHTQEITNRSQEFIPESIGTPIFNTTEFTYTPNFTVSEEDLNFFKSLKIQKDKSLISQSSEDFRMGNEQIDKTEERSHSCNKSSRSHQESNYHSESNEMVLDSQGDEDFSEDSFNESVLPDGISVCNQKLESLDEFEDFQFGTESPFGKKDQKRKREEKGKKQEQFGYYDVFSSHNLLKKEKQVINKQNPFPWLKQNEKKKTRKKQAQP